MNRQTLGLHISLQLVACLLVIGCEFSKPEAPAHLPTARVTGQILIAGTPVSPGWIYLMPSESAVGDHCVTALRPDGSFATDFAPVGKVQIRICLPEAAERELSYRDLRIGKIIGRVRTIASPLNLQTSPVNPANFDFDFAASVN